MLFAVDQPLAPQPPNLGNNNPDQEDAANSPASSSSSTSNNAFTKLGGSLKLLASDTIKTTAGGAAALASQVKVPWNSSPGGGGGGARAAPNPLLTSSGNPNKALDRFERRVLEEFHKLFNDSLSFYFSFSGDLTNSLQRQTALADWEADQPLWRRVDERFFFNRELLSEVIDLQDSRADPFIVPFIQGFVEVIFAPLNLEETESFYSDFQQQQPAGMALPPVEHQLPDFYSIALISRRNRHRAGTREGQIGETWWTDGCYYDSILGYVVHTFLLKFSSIYDTLSQTFSLKIQLSTKNATKKLVFQNSSMENDTRLACRLGL